MKAVRYVVQCSTKQNGNYIVNLLGECADKEEAVVVAIEHFGKKVWSDPDGWCRVVVVDLEAEEANRRPALVLANPASAETAIDYPVVV